MLLDYDVDIYNYSRKANKVADELRQKQYDTLTVMRMLPGILEKEIKDLALVIVHGRIANLEVRLIILEDIKNAKRRMITLLRLRNSTKKPRKVNLW